MAPSLSLEPGPATNDGIVPGPWNEERANASCEHIDDHAEIHEKAPVRGRTGSDGNATFLERPCQLVRSGMLIGTGRGIAGFAEIAAPDPVYKRDARSRVTMWTRSPITSCCGD